MKIAIIHGPFCLGGGANGFDFARLFTDKRGLSGSDLGVFRVSQELARLGHEVAIFTFPKPGTEIPPMLSPGVSLFHYDRREAVVDGSFRAAVSWNESDPLMCWSGRKDLLKCVSLQINTLVQGPHFDDYVDVWLSPSHSHRRMILGNENERVHQVGSFWDPKPYKPDPANWEVVPDGCDPDVYDKLRERGVVKQPGRVIWTSSPDRGLHWLLGAWPLIRKRCPEANLRIFYRLKPWLDHMNATSGEEHDPSITEQVRRARYIGEAFDRFQAADGMGVKVLDSVSRRDIAREQAEAVVFPYTCDPPGIWTEGFSCSLMESCAAGVLPISNAVDALEEIYGGVIPLFPRPNPDNMRDFAECVVSALRGDVLSTGKLCESVLAKARKLAERFTWAAAAKWLSDVIEFRV